MKSKTFEYRGFKRIGLLSQTIVEALKEIEEDEAVDVTEFEADFIENVAFKWDGPLSKSQIITAENIIDKYES